MGESERVRSTIEQKALSCSGVL